MAELDAGGGESDLYGPAPKRKASLTKYHAKLSHYRLGPLFALPAARRIFETGF